MESTRAIVAIEPAPQRRRFSSVEKSMEIRAFDELIKRGYILKKGSAIGFIIVSITSAGKYAAEQL